MGPIDYIGTMPQLNTQALSSLGDALVQRKLEKQQKSAMEQYRTDLENAYASGRPEAFAQLISKYPQQREALAESWDILEQSQKDAEFSEASQLYNALSSDPQVAMDMLDQRITAEKNSGGDPSMFERIKARANADPQAAKNDVAFLLSSLEPEKWSSMAKEMRDQELQGSAVKKAMAEAEKAAIDSKYAESMAVKELEEKNWNIWKMQNDVDISRQNARIAAMNAQYNKSNNDLKRLELQQKIDEAERKRDESIREKASELEFARFDVDNMLNTVDRALAFKDDVFDDITGTIDSKLFTFGEDEANLEELIENLKSQTFLTQIQKLSGMGALSNREGDTAAKALQNLSLRQSPEQLKKNLREVQRLMTIARKKMADKFGVPENIPDTPAILETTTPEMIDSLVQQYLTPKGQ